MKRIPTVALVVLQFVIILAMLVGTFVFARKTGELRCDHWCHSRIHYMTFDAYLACQSVCHDIEVSHVMCIFDKIDAAPANRFFNKYGGLVKPLAPPPPPKIKNSNPYGGTL